MHYACGVDRTCLVPLSAMESRIDPTEQDEKNVNKLLDHMATHTNAVILFHALDMILCADTNALYLTEPQEHSRDAGYFFLRNIPSKCVREHLNGLVHINCNILIFYFAASAAEDETSG